MIEPMDAISSRPLARALAETIKRICKIKHVHRRDQRHNLQDLGMATLGRFDWFNNRRRLGPIEHIPPAEAEENFYI
jgi:putative transposase